jgi:hypothetical protein
LAQFDLKSLARRGAAEAKKLLKVFPDLSDAFDADELPVSFLLRRGARRANLVATTRATRRRRKMTASQRKAVGERMRKYWAERRKTKANK